MFAISMSGTRNERSRGPAVEINRLLLAKFFYVEDVFFEGAIFPELFFILLAVLNISGY